MLQSNNLSYRKGGNGEREKMNEWVKIKNLNPILFHSPKFT
jgi:hypothetical protein